MSLTAAIVCWRHGTEIRIKSVAMNHNNQLMFSIEKCPDCAQEDRSMGYDRGQIDERSTQRGSPGHPDNEMGG